MIHFNPYSLLLLSVSSYSGYRCIKSSYHSLSEGAKAIFGTLGVHERIAEATVDIQQGQFSILKTIFGSESFEDRTKRVSRCCTSALAAFAYGLLSYSLYYYSSLRPSKSSEVLSRCTDALDEYQESKKLTWKKYRYWIHNLCELEKHHWDNVIPKVEVCFHASSSSNHNYEKINTFCEKTFNKETFNQANKFYIPRDEVNLSINELEQKRVTFRATCDLADQEINYRVNSQCNSMYPFVLIQSATLCPLIRVIPYKKDPDCLAICQQYMDQASEVQRILTEPIPKTKELSLHCNDVLKEKPVFSTDLIPKDKFLEPDKNVMQFLEGYKDFYSHYWEDGVHVHQDFNEEERLRNQKPFPWEDEEIDPSLEDFLQNIFMQRRRLIKDLEEKVKLKKTSEQSLLKDSEILKKAKMIYVN